MGDLFSNTDSSLFGPSQTVAQNTKPVVERETVDDSQDYFSSSKAVTPEYDHETEVSPHAALIDLINDPEREGSVENGLLQRFFEELPPAQYIGSGDAKKPANITAYILSLAEKDGTKGDATELLENLYRLQQAGMSMGEIGNLYSRYTEGLNDSEDNQFNDFLGSIVQDKDSPEEIMAAVRNAVRLDETRSVSEYNQSEPSMYVKYRTLEAGVATVYESPMFQNMSTEEKVAFMDRFGLAYKTAVTDPEDPKSHEEALQIAFNAAVIEIADQRGIDTSGERFKNDLQGLYETFIDRAGEVASDAGFIPEGGKEEYIEYLTDLFENNFEESFNYAQNYVRNNPLPNTDQIADKETAAQRMIDDVNRGMSQVDSGITRLEEDVEKFNKEALQENMQRFDDITRTIEDMKSDSEMWEKLSQAIKNELNRIESLAEEMKEVIRDIEKVQDKNLVENAKFLKSTLEKTSKLGKMRTIGGDQTEIDELTTEIEERQELMQQFSRTKELIRFAGSFFGQNTASHLDSLLQQTAQLVN